MGRLLSSPREEEEEEGASPIAPSFIWKLRHKLLEMCLLLGPDSAQDKALFSHSWFEFSSSQPAQYPDVFYMAQHQYKPCQPWLWLQAELNNVGYNHREITGPDPWPSQWSSKIRFKFG